MRSQFLINTTIAELINNLFIENYTTTLNYSSYFKECSPLLCSYTYIQQVNPLYTVTFLLGLQGGLTIVLQWLCPKIVRILAKVSQHRKKKMNIVQPAFTIEMTPTEIVNTTVRNPTFDIESMPLDVTSQYVSFIFISILTYSYLS